MRLFPDLGAQRLHDGDAVPWHQHPRAYAAIVLEGGYEEAGDGGRYRAVAGDVIVHPPYSAHCDRIDASGAVVVNVDLPPVCGLSLSSGRVVDAGKLASDIRCDAGDAVAILAAALVPAPALSELPDVLAAALSGDPAISLETWADAAGTSARTLRRQFALVYGVTPKFFRARANARRAWEQITCTDDAFAVIAHEAGFADQAHMSRAIRWLTGRRPTDWRLADAFKTAGLLGG